MKILSLLLFQLSWWTSVWCDEIERIAVPEDQPFSFDCQSDESVYFASTLNSWSELHDGDLGLDFQYLNDKNILRVKSNSAQTKHVGFYGCRKPTWTSTAMNAIFQLTLAGRKNSVTNFSSQPLT